MNIGEAEFDQIKPILLCGEWAFLFPLSEELIEGVYSMRYAPCFTEVAPHWLEERTPEQLKGEGD